MCSAAVGRPARYAPRVATCSRCYAVLADGEGALCASCLRHGARDHARERRQAPVPLPRGVSLRTPARADEGHEGAGAAVAYRGATDAGEAIEIVVRRASWREVAGALAVLPWLAIAYASSPIEATPPVPPGRWLFSLVFLIAGLLIARGPLQKLVGHVRVRASRAGLVVEERPFGARTSLPVDELAQLYVPSMEMRATDEGFVIPTSASIVAVRRDGKELVLLGGLETVEQARFLEQQLESALGVEDHPVAGEQPI